MLNTVTISTDEYKELLIELERYRNAFRVMRLDDRLYIQVDERFTKEKANELLEQDVSFNFVGFDIKDNILLMSTAIAERIKYDE